MSEDPSHDLIGQMIRYATVDSVDLAAGKLTARMGDIVTHKVRWLHPAAGATGSWSPPSSGEQILLLCPEGDVAGAIALRGVHSDANPPVGDSTRVLTRYADGAVTAYDPEAHALEVVLPAGATVSIVAPGGVTVEADVRIKGDLEVEGKIHATGDMLADTISLQSHKHGLVKTGTDKSGEPE